MAGLFSVSSAVMRMSAIAVTEPEELYLLNAFVDALASLPHDPQLFLVGDWPRSKLFKKVSYHFELVCLRKDFEGLREALCHFLASPASATHFRTQIFPAKAVSGKKEAIPSLSIRLFTHRGNKYKVSLDVLRNDSLFDDLAARDFSINALYCHVGSQVLWAFQDFYSDFGQRLIRTIRPPEATFGHRVNIFFRFVEFSVRYQLRISPQIIAYFAAIDPRTDIFQASLEQQPNNLYSSAKKFFSKHYVGQMLRLMTDLGLIDFFRLDFAGAGDFRAAFLSVLPLLDALEPLLKAPLPPVLVAAYPDGMPKVFFTKTRMFLIAQAFHALDPAYALSFLRVFLYNGKEPSDDLSQVFREIARLLAGRWSSLATQNFFEPPVPLRNVLSSISVDKSQWAFVLVFQVLHATRGEGLYEKNGLQGPGPH